MAILFEIFMIWLFPRIEYIKINKLINAHNLPFYPIVGGGSKIISPLPPFWLATALRRNIPLSKKQKNITPLSQH